MPYLTVSPNHRIHYEHVGNLTGPTILFCHGGPGWGHTKKDHDFFDLEKINVIFFDQRGVGKSLFTSDILYENKTEFLIQDMVKLLDHLRITEPVTLFGGSWGSTLALVFAIQYPQKVARMILRGIYLPCDQAEDFLIGTEKAYLYPDAWEHLLSFIPENRRDDVCGFFLEQLKSPDESVRKKFALEFSFFELLLAEIDPDPEKIRKKLKKDPDLQQGSLIEAYYLYHRCFLPENYILENAEKIESIPTTIVHGRYDAVCPAHDAWQLYKVLKNATIEFTMAGHRAHDSETLEALKKATTKTGYLLGLK